MKIELTESDRIALKQTLDFLKTEERKSHQGYFYSGWAGATLRRVFTKTAGNDSYGNEHFVK